MGKSIESGSVVYEIKAVNPNAVANFDAGKLVKAVGDDFIKFVGKEVQGLVVKANDAKGLVDQVKKDLVAKKVQQPWMRAGLSGKDMIFLVTDLKNPKYEESCILVADYKGVREKQKNLASMVVNLDKGDKVIDKAAKDMGKALGAKPTTEKHAKFGGVDDTANIVLLAHGDEDKTSSGQIYGKDFAGKSPKDLVKMLLDNPNEKKRLNTTYSGTIYLDGCFTAQGGAMQNYTKQVWDELKSRGVKNVKVKGNLGAAATLKSGDEEVTTTEAEEKADKLFKEAEKKFAKDVKPFDDKLDEILKTKFGGKKDDKFKKDPAVLKIKEAIDKLRDKTLNDLEKEQKKIPGYQVKNLVGTFGLNRIN